MKPSYRYYNADRGARFTSGDRKLTLRKNDLFRLELYEGHPCVIKDGVVYRVNDRLVSELKRRSETASVTKMAKARSEFLNLHGIDIERALVKNAAATVADLHGSSVVHAYANDQVYLTFDTSDYSDTPISVEFSINKQSVKVAAYSKQREPLTSWQALPVLNKAFSKFAKYLSTKYGVSIGKTVKGSATFANVQVSGKPFSGRTYSFSANWDF